MIHNLYINYINKIIHIMENDSAIKKMKSFLYATMWMELE